MVARRPPKMMALMGTPSGESASGASAGLLRIGAVKREFGWAAFSLEAGVQGRPCQSRHSAGAGSSWPSHQTVPSGLSATLVKMVSRDRVTIALGLVLALVPGATPK